ncbi:MAG: hypothetical protein ACYSUI_10820, partial [Planctomycetota bacterium]
GPEILEQVKQVHANFGGLFVVENNAAQHYIVQFLRDQSAVPVVPFTTGRNRAHPEYGVESLAAEFAGGKWIIPAKSYDEHGRWRAKLDKEVEEWITELLFYDPREHVGDRVMASWFAREGARRYADAIRGGGGGVRVRAFG